MANQFTIYGEIKVDTKNLKQSLKETENSLKQSTAEITRQEKAAKELGDTSAATAKQFQAMRDSANQVKASIESATQAYKNGSISTDEYAKRVSNAERDAKKLDTTLKDNKASMDGAAAAGASFATKLTAVVAAAAAVAVAAKQAADTVYAMATAAADAAREVGDLQRVTGLSATTLSAFQIVANATGQTFEDISRSIQHFTNVIGEADGGSKEAITTLERFGLAPREAVKNLDGALVSVLQQINNLQNPIDRATAANYAFGSSGKALLPILEQSDGNIAKVIERARELGIVMGQDSVDAARRFDDATNKLNAQLQNLWQVLGREVIPMLTQFFSSVSDWLARNKSEWENWGKIIVGAIELVKRGILSLPEFMRGNFIGGTIAATLPASNDGRQPIGGQRVLDYSRDGRTPDLSDIEGKRKAEEQARKEQERAYRERLNLFQQYASEALKAATHLYEQERDKLEASLRARTITQVQFGDALTDILQRYANTAQALQQRVYKTDLALAQDNQQKQQVALIKHNNIIATIEARINDEVLRGRQALNDSLKSMQEAALSHTRRTLEQIKELWENFQPTGILDSIRGDDRGFGAGGSAPEPFGEDAFMKGVGPPPALIPAWENFFEYFKNRLKEMGGQLGTAKQALGETLMGAISQVGDIFADAVYRWDGTIKGLFKSIGQGFADLARQIIAQLIRILVYKAIFGLISMMAGGGFMAGFNNPGGVFGGGVFGGGGGGGGGHPTGGGSGSFFGGTSAFAPAFAGAGGSTSSITQHNSFAPVIHMQGSGNAAQDQRTAAMVRRQVVAALQEEQRRNK